MEPADRLGRWNFFFLHFFWAVQLANRVQAAARFPGDFFEHWLSDDASRLPTLIRTRPLLEKRRGI
jgi:hypothetical protein